MAPGTALRAAFLLLALDLPVSAQAPPGDGSPGYYEPLPIRREVLLGWEKAKDPHPPEIVAGIYERDWQGCDFRDELAVTIDDCLPNATMARELDILKARGVKATFFIIGRAFFDSRLRPMPRARELLGRVVAEGHVIGSHSYYHRRMDLGRYRDDAEAIREELDRNEEAIDRILGYHYPVAYFRPPNGAHSSPGYVLDRVLKARGQYLANWTITSFDWCMRLKPGNPDRIGPDEVVARTVRQAREDRGGVILLHGFPETADILGRVLSELLAARGASGGFSFVGLDEILRLKYGERP